MFIEISNRRIPWSAAGFEVGKGWRPLVRWLCYYCHINDISILQIKEKWGTLRFYTNSPRAQAVRDVEWIADNMCEQCGTMENVSKGPRDPRATYGWIKTLCENCRGNPTQWDSKWRGEIERRT